MDSVNFDINDALKHYMSDPFSVPTIEADGSLQECENDPDSLTDSIVDPVLDHIVDAIAESPDSLSRALYFDSLQFLLKSVAHLRHASSLSDMC